MQQFREFELLVRPQNTDVFLWQMDETTESIAKVRKTDDVVHPAIDKTAFQAA